MKNKIQKLSILSVLVSFLFLSKGMAQELTKKELKQKARVEKQKQTQLLIDSKEFVFITNMATPQSGRLINLTEDYSIEFNVDSIKSELPFFGRGFSGIGYGGDNGLRFKGKAENYQVEKTKKATIIKAGVKGQQDYFTLMLSIYDNGSAYLFVSSNNRSTISFNGEIKAVNKK
ncbi:DUF4251 domain-containing protein [Flavobacterium eburneipallidum]|uniref:DUF4251 domain-containing protein n=1 Tax=Flavobacterium eburneipallidum TaxID=3003263 RepID=UPI0022AC349F|nr:DUF4251 domain-containing protein [Flavobacterium eburneipallidum]